MAAGGSRRLGQPKQLVTLEGEPLVRRAARLAIESGCEPVIVVVGACEQPCRGALDGLPAVRIVHNSSWAQGMSTSLRAGVAALEGDGMPKSTLVLVCDQFGLTARSLERLLSAHADSTAPATAARYAGKLGVPAVFRAEMLPALATLSGDQGARRLLNAWADRVTAVDLPEAAADLDTPADLAWLE
jgi:CTP:molybdopterin cytidylyltransferase MocA